MKIESCAACDIGLGRETNEDRFLVDKQLNMLAVSDGMGGHAAGEVAAKRSLEIAAEFMRSRGPIEKMARASPDGYFRVLQLAEDALEEASRRVYQQASAEAACAGMGATLTMLVVVDDKGIIAHVGDSRLYLLRGQQLHLLTNDHTVAEEMFQAGAISREQANRSPYANALTRAIGTQPAVQVETLLFDLLPSDICLLCSDGLSNYFSDPSEIVSILSDEDLESVADRLVEFAISHGGRDNITAVVGQVDVASTDEPADPQQLQNCLDALASTFLFKGLSLSRLSRVLNIAQISDCPRGQSILSSGDRCEGLYVVLDGSFSVTCPGVAVEELVRGGCYGAECLLLTRPSPASIVARSSGRMLYIPGADFDRLTRRQPKLGRNLLRRLGEHLSQKLHKQSDGVNLSDTIDM